MLTSGPSKMQVVNHDEMLGKKKIARRRQQTMKWTPANDRKLLHFGLGKEIGTNEHQKLANVFPERPTAKAIQERLGKLRKEEIMLLQTMGIVPKDVASDGMPGDDESESEQASSVGHEDPAAMAPGGGATPIAPPPEVSGSGFCLPVVTHRGTPSSLPADETPVHEGEFAPLVPFGPGQTSPQHPTAGGVLDQVDGASDSEIRRSFDVLLKAADHAYKVLEDRQENAATASFEKTRK